MAVEGSQVPIESHQNCKHLISHLMTHHGGLLVPSTQANKKETKRVRVSFITWNYQILYLKETVKE